MIEKQISLKEIELKEIKDYINIAIYITKVILIVFSILFFIFTLLLKIQLSLFIPIILCVWLLVYFFYDNFIDKKNSVDEIHNLHFKIAILEIFFITLIVHFIGGVEWIGGVFYFLNILLSSIILPKKKSRILIFIAIILFSVLIGLEFYEVIPHHILLEESSFQNPLYIILTITVLFFFLLFSADMIGSFSEVLREDREALVKARTKISKALEAAKEAKDVLEIKVEARTKELEDLAKDLESQVAQRTNELEKKIGELEKTNKLMVGRELKMIELKREIKNLKKQ